MVCGQMQHARFLLFDGCDRDDRITALSPSAESIPKALQGFPPGAYVAGMTTLYTRDEAARRLHVAPNTLRRWAHLGRGPRFVRTGDVRGRTLYAEDDLAAWLEQRKQTPATSARDSQGG